MIRQTPEKQPKNHRQFAMIGGPADGGVYRLYTEHWDELVWTATGGDTILGWYRIDPDTDPDTMPVKPPNKSRSNIPRMLWHENRGREPDPIPF